MLRIGEQRTNISCNRTVEISNFTWRKKGKLKRDIGKCGKINWPELDIIGA